MAIAEIEKFLSVPQESNDQREKHRELGQFNLFNQYNQARLVQHMREHVAFVEECRVDKELLRRIYGSKSDMVKDVYYLTLQYLRGMRAYHFKNRIAEGKDAEKAVRKI